MALSSSNSSTPIKISIKIYCQLKRYSSGSYSYCFIANGSILKQEASPTKILLCFFNLLHLNFVSRRPSFSSSFLLLVFAFQAKRHGITVIGKLQDRLNRPSSNMLHFHRSHLGLVIETGLVIRIVSLTEGIAVGKTFTTLKNCQGDGNKKMIMVELIIQQYNCRFHYTLHLELLLLFTTPSALTVLHEIAPRRDLKQLLVIIAGLWDLSVIRSWCNFLTLFYIAFVLLHNVPI